MDLINKYFSNLSTEQIKQFASLDELYKEWNAKINVISRKDIDNLYLHHVLHSLAIAKVIKFKPGADIVDVGTGGGFPGLPLAIMFPKTNFLLIDSVGKKLQVVEQICREIKLNNVKTSHVRAEELEAKFDFAVSRAVTRLDTVWGWVAPKFKSQNNHDLPNGLLYLKGGDISSELPKNVKLLRLDLSKIYSESYFSEKALVLLSHIDAQ